MNSADLDRDVDGPQLMPQLLEVRFLRWRGVPVLDVLAHLADDARQKRVRARIVHPSWPLVTPLSVWRKAGRSLQSTMLWVYEIELIPKGTARCMYLMIADLPVEEPRWHGLQLQRLKHKCLRDAYWVLAEGPMVLGRGSRIWGATRCWCVLAKALGLAHDRW
ncbi:hypothetical protein PC9H_009337 [Pleurotus ostreatus]|uniref:Uncharacterized protein n=1 Tax=Pleurotus ostreatus TaxID=5322 RepID=A0A8H6ZNV1_PLEOS|nr:uncharacterized protein PC9H_009337 [Pleurotus ostreatus]KAF7424037.1 hypothetical protein PC9H_009337 [Pleurotus ostreatus]